MIEWRTTDYKYFTTNFTTVYYYKPRRRRSVGRSRKRLHHQKKEEVLRLNISYEDSDVRRLRTTKCADNRDEAKYADNERL